MSFENKKGNKIALNTIISINLLMGNEKFI